MNIKEKKVNTIIVNILERALEKILIRTIVSNKEIWDKIINLMSIKMMYRVYLKKVNNKNKII